MPLLSVKNIWKRYNPGDEAVVRGLSFELEAGEILALLGPSGCGKTTALRVIAGFEEAEEGVIRLRERILANATIHSHPETRGIGFVFQDYALFPHMNVLKNVCFGLKGLPRKERHEKARRALDLVDLNGLDKRNPHELSGGQQQRVALARSLAPSPKVLLLDEPFSNLDAGLRSETRAEVRRILKDAGTGVVLVTHDQEEALTFADRIAVMHEGRLEQIGAPQTIYREPATAFVAEFLGSTNLIEGEASGRQAETPLGTLQLSREAQGPVLLSVRPEQITMDPPDNGAATGVVTAHEFKGHDQYYRVRLGEREFYVMTDHLAAFKKGERVTLHTAETATVVEAE